MVVMAAHRAARRRGAWSNGPVTLVVASAAVAAVSAWVALRAAGIRWPMVPLLFAVALPTLFVVYIVTGLVRHTFGI